MKKVIKTIIFILIFVILFHCTFNILWLNKNGTACFFEEPSNSFDIVYLGASNAYRHFNTVLAYKLYGFTTGMLSTDSQPFPTIEYLIKESEKYQKPNLYVIDITRIVDDLSDIKEEYIRKSVDSMKFSQNRICAINKTLSYKNIKKSDYINYYFSFMKYHNRWKDISNITLKPDKDLYKGFLCSARTVKIDPQDNFEWKEDITELKDENKQLLIDLIKYIKTNDLKVLFVIPNRYFEDESLKKLNNATEIIKESDLDIINFNKLEDLEIDFSTDLWNFAHLNIYGITKYTKYFSKYLKENYELEDHRKNEEYNSWDSEYERFKVNFNKLTGKNFDELL